MSGLSRAAHVGVVIKGGGALEALAGGRVMLFDKTGTLTQGHPVLADVITADGVDADELLRLAASLDQVSPHVLASAIVTGGTRRGLALQMPESVQEVHGYGLEGTVGGHESGSVRRPGSSVTPPRSGFGRFDGAPIWTVRSVSSSPSTTNRPAPSCCRTRSGPMPPGWSGRCARPGSPASSWSPATAPISRT
jgi:hypothetical protein